MINVPVTFARAGCAAPRRSFYSRLVFFECAFRNGKAAVNIAGPMGAPETQQKRSLASRFAAISGACRPEIAACQIRRENESAISGLLAGDSLAQPGYGESRQRERPGKEPDCNYQRASRCHP